MLPVLAGFLVLLPALYFIFPPGDSQLNIQFWLDRWRPSQLYLIITVVVKSLFPLQDVMNPHWWNTNFLLDNNTFVFRILSFVLFIFLLIAIISSVRKNKTALVLLIVNLAITGMLSLVFPLNSARYVGFVFIGYLVSVWIAMNKGSQVNRIIFQFVLLLQVPAACFAFSYDYREKFSSAEKAVDVLKSDLVAPGSFVVTDYWSLNNLSAYMDSSFYTIELQRKSSFLLWKSEMKEAIRFDYGKGLSHLLKQNNKRPFYFFTMKNPEQAALWSNELKATLLFFSGPAIERSGEIYLYRIEAIQ
jgi:hypothetical protein